MAFLFVHWFTGSSFLVRAIIIISVIDDPHYTFFFGCCQLLKAFFIRLKCRSKVWPLNWIQKRFRLLSITSKQETVSNFVLFLNYFVVVFFFFFIEIWIVLSFWSNNNRNELAGGYFLGQLSIFSFCEWFIECWKYVPVNQSIDSKDFPNESVTIFLQLCSLCVFVVSDSRNFYQKLCAWIWMKWLSVRFWETCLVRAFELNELQHSGKCLMEFVCIRKRKPKTHCRRKEEREREIQGLSKAKQQIEWKPSTKFYYVILASADKRIDAKCHREITYISVWP